jgi:hypothetical protein
MCRGPYALGRHFLVGTWHISAQSGQKIYLDNRVDHIVECMYIIVV